MRERTCCMMVIINDGARNSLVNMHMMHKVVGMEYWLKICMPNNILLWEILWIMRAYNISLYSGSHEACLVYTHPYDYYITGYLCALIFYLHMCWIWLSNRPLMFTAIPEMHSSLTVWHLAHKVQSPLLINI